MKQKKKTCNRKRNTIVNFRMSEEEKAVLDKKIAISGLLKQDYMTQIANQHKVSFAGNVKVFDELRKAFSQLGEKLDGMETVDDMDYETMEMLKFLRAIYEGEVLKR